jgi:hypothetical protein
MAQGLKPAQVRSWWVIAKSSMVKSLAGIVFSIKLFISLNVSYEFQNISPASLFPRMGQILIVSPRHAFQIVVFHAA